MGYFGIGFIVILVIIMHILNDKLLLIDIKEELKYYDMTDLFVHSILGVLAIIMFIAFWPITILVYLIFRVLRNIKLD